MAFQLLRYRNDIVLKRPYPGTQPPTVTRSDCGVWSKKSRDRLAFVASNTGIEFRAMITVTYPSEFPHTGHMVKTHIKTLLQALRDALKPSACLSYLWFVEFQKRGAPHVHFLVNRPCQYLPAKSWFSSTWYRIVGSGDPLHLAAGTRVENLRDPRAGAHYAVKYAQKMHQKAIPEGFTGMGRFWAHSRDVAPWPLAPIVVETIEEVEAMLADWPYCEKFHNSLWTTLYNAARYLKTP